MGGRSATDCIHPQSNDDVAASGPSYKAAMNIWDGRQLGRYCRRWKIERLFAWPQYSRRLVTRYERHVANFLAFEQLGCIVILGRQIAR